MKNFEDEYNLTQTDIEDLWNKYIFTSYKKNQFSINYKNLSEYDNAFLKYIISKIESNIKEKKEKWVIVNTASRYKSKSRKKQIILFPILSYLIKKRNENIKNFEKFSNIFFINSIFIILNTTIYFLYFLLLPISLYGFNFLR